MRRSLTRLTLLAILAGSAVLVACRAPVKPEPPPKLDPEVAVEQANVLIASGQNAQAFGVLDQAARDNPVSGKPWLRKAQLQFEQADYPGAIVSAQEAVKRDPTSQEGRSVAVVASLRIAIRSLTELRGEQNLNSNAQAEAQRLASLLRESLSTDLLVPPEPIVEPARKPLKRAVRRPPPTAAKTDTIATTPAAASGGDDPFGALRK